MQKFEEMYAGIYRHLGDASTPTYTFIQVLAYPGTLLR